MKDKIILVTGGSAGVGRACALGLARLGARLVLLSRDRQRAEAVRRELIAATGNEQVDLLTADLSRPQSVRQAAAEFESRYERLDVLLNCAGVLFLSRTSTAEGLEMTFAVEYLGHFQLTNLLLDLLKGSRPARILTVTGNAWPLKLVRIRFEDLQLRKRYNPVRAKLQAELAKALFAVELARRLQGSGVTSNAFHPGLVRSAMIRNLPWFLRGPASAAIAVLARESRSGLHLASSPEVEGVSGRFFVKPNKVADFSFDADAADRLWRIAAELRGLA